MVCQWGRKVLLYRKASTRQRNLQSWGKGCRTSLRAQHRRTGDKVVQWHWQRIATSRMDHRKETVFSVESLDTCQGLQEEGDSTKQQEWWEWSPRWSMQETKRWRQTWVSGNGYNIGFTRRGTLGSSYPVIISRHTSGQWLYRSHSEDHRRVPGLIAHSISGQKSQRRNF